jgi:hypothetical protein
MDAKVELALRPSGFVAGTFDGEFERFEPCGVVGLGFV